MEKSSPIICKTVKHNGLYDMFYYHYGEIVDQYLNLDYWSMKYRLSQWKYNSKAYYERKKLLKLKGLSL